MSAPPRTAGFTGTRISLSGRDVSSAIIYEHIKNSSDMGKVVHHRQAWPWRPKEERCPQMPFERACAWIFQ